MHTKYSGMNRWINACRAILIGSTICGSCSTNCGCDEEHEATLVDYTTTVETDQFKVCLSSDTSATKDGVFYYTNPSGYEIYNCKGPGNIKIKNPVLDDGYSTVLFVDKGTLFINHHKSRTVSKKYCANAVNTQCDFWVRYKEMYNKNGSVDTVSEIHYPHITRETAQSYIENFESALSKASTDKNFAENAVSMKGFDYYGHAEDLFVAALNGDRAAEDKFRNYRALTNDLVAKKIYSPYREEFNEGEDQDFFKSATDVLDEANEYKRRH
jgi:hypothetical protein